MSDVVTLREHIEALMEERDRRYEENRTCDQEAVKLAKIVAVKAEGKVNVVTVIAIASLLLAAWSKFG